MSRLFFMLAVATSGCSVVSPGVINEKYREVLEQRHENYQIKAGDNINIEFYGVDDATLNQNVLVLPDGRGDVFFMGQSKLAGNSVPELEEAVRAGMADQLRPADIRIQVQPAAEAVFMVGEFERPGALPLTTKMTLQQAIAASGGVRLTADTDWALLRRPVLDPRHPDLFRIDLNDESEALYLLPGDQIILSRTTLASIVAYMRDYIFGIFPPWLTTVGAFF